MRAGGRAEAPDALKETMCQRDLEDSAKSLDILSCDAVLHVSDGHGLHLIQTYDSEREGGRGRDHPAIPYRPIMQLNLHHKCACSPASLPPYLPTYLPTYLPSSLPHSLTLCSGRVVFPSAFTPYLVIKFLGGEGEVHEHVYDSNEGTANCGSVCTVQHVVICANYANIKQCYIKSRIKHYLKNGRAMSQGFKDKAKRRRIQRK
jgi:hypothetical protein